MKISLPYGYSQKEVEIPSDNVACILETETRRSVPDEKTAILQALRNPVGTGPLIDLITPSSNVVIIVSDATRPCPDDRILPVLLSELTLVVPPERISLLVALGLHPPMTDNQMEIKFGRDIVNRYPVINHEPGSTVSLGTTSYGTLVEVNRAVARADVVISTGFIEPHFFAGFSGGRKSIAPGVSSARSIRHNHGFSMLGHPLARAGILKGNPVHEDMVEQARIAGLDFIVNVLLNRDREITHVLAGNPFAAHEIGCHLCKDSCGVTAPHQVDISIVTNNGAPLDLDLYQTCKGIDTAARITRSGGIIIAVSSCLNGVGPGSFHACHAACASPADVMEKVSRECDAGVGWQNQVLARAQLSHEILLVSELDEGLLSGMMITPAVSVEAAVTLALKKLGNSSEIGVIPEGPVVLPLIDR